MISQLKARLEAMARESWQQPEAKEKPTPQEAAQETVCAHECHDIPLAPETLAAYRQLTGDVVSLLDRRPWPNDFDPMDTVFVDTETTGLSGGAGTVAFLIGVGYFEGEQWRVEQFLMRDYDEESDMLRKLLALLERHRTLVTYNGKCFDSPLLQNRGIMNRIRLPMDAMAHLDLLPMARRLYKRSLPRCSLQAMEQALLGMTRQDDIPGAEIPEVFFAFLRDGDMTRLAQVMRHNQQDITSMVALLGCFAAVARDPAGQDDPAVRYSVALLMAPEAREGLLRGVPLASAQLTLAEDLKRGGRRLEALAIWETLIGEGKGGFEPYREAAMYYEHEARDWVRALALTEQALSLQRIYAAGDQALKTALERRRERLRNKLRRR